MNNQMEIVNQIRLGLDQILVESLDIDRPDIAECIKLALVLAYEGGGWEPIEVDAIDQELDQLLAKSIMAKRNDVAECLKLALILSHGSIPMAEPVKGSLRSGHTGGI